MKRCYVVGFAFNWDASRVALIQKNRPAWQCGLLNGIGGRIEPGEDPAQAMEREFEEEAGVRVGAAAWRYFAVIHTPNVSIEFFTVRLSSLFLSIHTVTDEVVRSCQLPIARGECIPNLTWLVPLARYVLMDDRSYSPIVVASSGDTA